MFIGLLIQFLLKLFIKNTYCFIAAVHLFLLTFEIQKDCRMSLWQENQSKKNVLDHDEIIIIFFKYKFLKYYLLFVRISDLVLRELKLYTLNEDLDKAFMGYLVLKNLCQRVIESFSRIF